MGAFYEQIPTALQKHIKGITRSSGLPQSDDSVELMSEAWLNKKEAFERELEARNMEEVASLDKYDERGAVVMTYSGSLINIGPLMGDTRQVEYSSIGLRADVPDSADHNAALLMEDVEVDREVSFEEGPVSSTSSVYKIAVCSEELSADDQEAQLSGMTQVLTQEFADINKTLIIQ